MNLLRSEPAGRAGRAFVNRKRKLYRHMVRAQSWLLNLWGERHYRVLSESELRLSRKSDTVFIFGSGYSINDVSDSEWEHFAQHDTIGFNWFVRQQQVRIDFHLIREIGNRYGDPSPWWPEINEYMGFLHSNHRYAETILIVQAGWTAIGGNQVVGRELLPKRNALFRFRTHSRGPNDSPSSSLSKGLVHGSATLTDCVNFASLLGWKKIVLVGVDLYDRRYFWLGPDETTPLETRRGARFDDAHSTAGGGLIENLGRWAQEFEEHGVSLFVYNPKSLLAATVPVYPRAPVSEGSMGS